MVSFSSRRTAASTSLLLKETNDEHGVLDGSDSFGIDGYWSFLFGPNHWPFRCFLVKVVEPGIVGSCSHWQGLGAHSEKFYWHGSYFNLTGDNVLLSHLQVEEFEYNITNLKFEATWNNISHTRNGILQVQIIFITEVITRIASMLQIMWGAWECLKCFQLESVQTSAWQTFCYTDFYVPDIWGVCTFLPTKPSFFFQAWFPFCGEDLPNYCHLL